MKNNNIKRKNKLLIAIIIIAIILAGLYGAFSVYLGNYYHSGSLAASSLKSDDTVTVNRINDNLIAFEPDEVKIGLIFYPGGKVEFTAYAPLMHELARNGILCILPHMPGNLAVFDINAADGLRELYPDVTDWYIGGHSLGGSMAASYILKHTNDYTGLILLASYSTQDLSSTNLNCITIYGSNDKVLNLQKYNKYKSNLPSEFTEYIIDGGCHAYFGNYGEQDGDGTPDITNEEQILTTTDYIMNSIFN